MATRYSTKDFTYKIDKTGYQILFKGQVFQSTRVNFAADVDIEELAVGISGSIGRMVDQTDDEVLDWQLHWNDVSAREV